MEGRIKELSIEIETIHRPLKEFIKETESEGKTIIEQQYNLGRKWRNIQIQDKQNMGNNKRIFIEQFALRGRRNFQQPIVENNLNDLLSMKEYEHQNSRQFRIETDALKVAFSNLLEIENKLINDLRKRGKEKYEDSSEKFSYSHRCLGLFKEYLGIQMHFVNKGSAKGIKCIMTKVVKSDLEKAFEFVLKKTKHGFELYSLHPELPTEFVKDQLKLLNENLGLYNSLFQFIYNLREEFKSHY